MFCELRRVQIQKEGRRDETKASKVNFEGTALIYTLLSCDLDLLTPNGSASYM